MPDTTTAAKAATTPDQGSPNDEYKQEKVRQQCQKEGKPMDAYQPNWFQRKWRSYKSLVASGPSNSDVDRGPGGVQGQLGAGVYKN